MLEGGLCYEQILTGPFLTRNNIEYVFTRIYLGQLSLSSFLQANLVNSHSPDVAALRSYFAECRTTRTLM